MVKKGCIRNKWVKNAQTRTNCVNRLSQLFLRNFDGMKKFINHADCFSEQKQYKKIIRHTGKVHLFSWGLKLIALSLFAPQFIVPWRYRFYYVYYFISGYCSHFIPQESTSLCFQWVWKEKIGQKQFKIKDKLQQTLRHRNKNNWKYYVSNNIETNKIESQILGFPSPFLVCAKSFRHWIFPSMGFYCNHIQYSERN